MNTTTDGTDTSPGDGICATSGGQCSLRAAIQESNALPGADTIVLPSGTYALTIPGRLEFSSAAGDLNIVDSLTISGAGAATTIVQSGALGGSALDRLFRISLTDNSGVVNISGVTLTHGNPGIGASDQGDNDGGAVLVLTGTLNLTDAVINNNVAEHGSGIEVLIGNAVLTRVRIFNNLTLLPSGAITGGSLVFSGGTIKLESVEVSSNFAGAAEIPTGLYLTQGNSAQVNNSLFDGQDLLNSGTGTLSIANTTFRTGGFPVNSISAGPPSGFTNQTTLTNVTAEGGTLVTSPGGLLQIQNSILFGSSCSGIASLGHNLVTSACPTGNGTDLTTVVTDPTFAPLADNGGFTKTIQILPGNLALDAADSLACPAFDQRGTIRPQDGNNDGIAACDMGAYELAPTDAFYAVPTATNPASPANNNNPTIMGTAPPNLGVVVFPAPNCSGTSVNTTAGADGIFSVVEAVIDNTTHTFSAQVIPTGQHQAPCSNGVTYVEDSLPPGAPFGLSTSPLSPSNQIQFILQGSAEAGSSVSIYPNNSCGGSQLGVAPSNGTFQIAITVPMNSTTVLSAKAVDGAGNASPCSNPVTYIEDSAPPVAPSGLTTSPASPSNATQVTVQGSAETGSTVSVYLNNSCGGSAAGTTSSNGTFSRVVTVPVNATTSITAKATDAAGNVSPCSGPIAFVQDSIAPLAPSGLATNPISPSLVTNPSVTGSAEANAHVQIFSNSACSGAPIASGTSAGTFQIPINVLSGTTTTLSANAVDAAGNVSLCSASITYVNPGPSISIGSVALQEGSKVNTVFAFPVTLSSPANRVVSVSFATADGTALAGSDYIAVSGTLNIPSGSKSAVINVTVIGDLVVEPNETFFVNLIKASGGVIQVSKATGTVVNDDAVGVGSVIPGAGSVPVGVPITYALTWVVPPLTPDGSRASIWKDLATLTIRFRNDMDTIMQVLWDREANTFAVFNTASDKYGPAFPAGSGVPLESPFGKLMVANSSSKGGGPTSPMVTVTLTIAFKPDAAGTYVVEIGATDIFGQIQPFEPAGTLVITKP